MCGEMIEGGRTDIYVRSPDVHVVFSKPKLTAAATRSDPLTHDIDSSKCL
jgi:hypothetical protein